MPWRIDLSRRPGGVCAGFALYPVSAAASWNRSSRAGLPGTLVFQITWILREAAPQALPGFVM
jgi:hypothetical protein